MTPPYRAIVQALVLPRETLLKLGVKFPEPSRFAKRRHLTSDQARANVMKRYAKISNNP